MPIIKRDSDRNFYLDTSVIIARYRPSDGLHKHSGRLFSLEGFNFYISPLTLVELYSVLSRVKDQLDLPLPQGHVLDTLVAFTVKDCRLRMLSPGNFVERKVFGQSLRIPLEYHIPIRFAEKLRLRTLDLIHIAHAWRAKGIDAFVTGDEEILRKAEDVEKIFKVQVIHPSRAT